MLTCGRSGAVVDSIQHVLGGESTKVCERLCDCREVEASHAPDTDSVVSDDRDVLGDSQIRVLHRGDGPHRRHVVRDEQRGRCGLQCRASGRITRRVRESTRYDTDVFRQTVLRHRTTISLFSRV